VFYLWLFLSLKNDVMYLQKVTGILHVTDEMSRSGPVSQWVVRIRGSGSQCCGSGMFITDPGSWFLPIPDPGSKKQQQKRGVKKNLFHTFLFSQKFHKIDNYFSF
jgi:hypothetical protein